MFNYIKNLKPKSKDLRIFSLILLTLLLVLIFFSYSKQNIFLIKVCFFGLMIAMIGIIKPKLIPRPVARPRATPRSALCEIESEK